MLDLNALKEVTVGNRCFLFVSKMEMIREKTDTV